MAAFNTINTLCLTFNTHVQSVINPFTKSTDIVLVEAKIIPESAQFSAEVVNICTEMAQKYIFELGEKFKPIVLACEARLCFSAREGVVIKGASDPDFQKISFKKCTQAQMKRFAVPTTLNLQIKGYNALNTGRELTTGTLRFPHMYKDIFETIPPEVRSSDQTSICIVGPGLDTMDSKMPTCPQAAELLSLFPKANFLLLDNNEELLKRLKQYQALKMFPYDSLALRMRTMTSSHCKMKNDFIAPDDYIKIFDEMAASFGDLASYPPNAKAMLVEKKGKLDRVMLKLDQEKFAVREFDIVSSEFLPGDKQFDVIVATLSIGNALSDVNGQIFNGKALVVLAKFLSKLKSGGTLYVDIATYSQIVDDKYHELVSLVGSQLKVELVSIKDFMKSVEGELGMLPCFNQYGDFRISTISSASVIAITKLDVPIHPVFSGKS